KGIELGHERFLARKRNVDAFNGDLNLVDEVSDFLPCDAFQPDRTLPDHLSVAYLNLCYFAINIELDLPDIAFVVCLRRMGYPVVQYGKIKGLNRRNHT